MKILGVNVNRKGDGSDFKVFKLSDVKYINVIRKKNKDPQPIYHTSKGSYQEVSTLRDLSTMLSDKGFKRIDKSVIVNISKIKEIYKGEIGIIVVFTDESSINISSDSKYFQQSQVKLDPPKL